MNENRIFEYSENHCCNLIAVRNIGLEKRIDEFSEII
jgi:hypothetical protein